MAVAGRLQPAVVFQPEAEVEPHFDVNNLPQNHGMQPPAMNVGVMPAPAGSGDMDFGDIANHYEPQHPSGPAPPLQQQQYMPNAYTQPMAQMPPYAQGPPPPPPVYQQAWQPEQQAQYAAPPPPPPDPYAPSAGFISVDDEKSDLLLRFARVKKKGMHVRDFTMGDDILEMRSEYTRVHNECDMEVSIDYSRKMLLAVVGTLEVLNKKYDPFDLYLDGWCDSVGSSIGRYDNVLERLYYKWRNKITLSPEVELMLSLGGSAFMFHMTSQLIKPAMSGQAQTGRNGDLLRNMVSAFTGVPAAAQAGPPPQRVPEPMGGQQQPGHAPYSSAYEMKGPSINLAGMAGMFQNRPAPTPPVPMRTTPQPMAPPVLSRQPAPVPVPVAVVLETHQRQISDDNGSQLSNRITEDMGDQTGSSSASVIVEEVSSTEGGGEKDESSVSTPPVVTAAARGRGRGRGRGTGTGRGRGRKTTTPTKEESIDIDSD